jgi:putative ABC transport system substrate-binding protein
VQREPFERGLRELGWTPGSNIIIERRYAEGRVERLPELAAELVRQKVDVIVTRGPQATQAARQATSMIPIVMSANPDPVGLGFIASLARPGGNITGLSFLAQGALDGKYLELLKETVPRLARVAILTNPLALQDPDGSVQKGATAAARILRLEIQTYEVRRLQDLAEAFTAMSRARIGALLVRADPHVFESSRTQVVALALRHRLPAVYPWRLYVDAGGLMSYGASIPDFHRRSAGYVDKILKGAKPADLPVQQPVKFELVINLKTAKALGLTIPPSLLVRADEVIK